MSCLWVLLFLWLISMPITYAYPLYLLEKDYLHNEPLATEGIDAIVILGGGLTDRTMHKRPNLTVGLLERVRFGAFLQRESSLPILVSGAGFHARCTEAEVMKEVLENEFHAKVKYVEDRSNTTHENAKFTVEMLKKNGLKRVFLLTSSWHLKRALFLFEKYADRIEIIPIADFFYVEKKFVTGWDDSLLSA